MIGSTFLSIKLYLAMNFLSAFIFPNLDSGERCSIDAGKDLKNQIDVLYNSRSKAIVTGDISNLKSCFDISQQHGRSAYEHEVKRIRYLNDWCSSRGMRFTDVTSSVRIKKVVQDSDTTKVNLEESYKFEYTYPTEKEATTNSFGVGLRHILRLVHKDGKPLIFRDTYTDCFEDALKGYDNITGSIHASSIPMLKLSFTCKNTLEQAKSLYYNRVMAVHYADKYCGAASGEGNNYMYNNNYRDLNGIGGDCTNFISQVLGDKEGGALNQDNTWFWNINKDGGRSWVNAKSFHKYIINSGKGEIIKSGNLSEVLLPSEDFPNGAIDKLQLGDVICYVKAGTPDHFAVVTGWNSKGYPLVNSHTTDRYLVPWDLGWGDKNISFHLIHIK